jgi:hypothetical protein
MPEMKYARGEFHARIRQVERGVFRAEYSGEVNPENPDERELLDFHIGTSEEDVRVWVEEMAKGLGYTKVIWLDD